MKQNKRMRGSVRALIVGLGGAFAVSACATQSIEPLPADFDFGEPPENYDALIRAHFDLVLKDPESARYAYEDGWAKVQCNGLTVRWQERQLNYAGWGKSFGSTPRTHMGDTSVIPAISRCLIRDSCGK